MHTRKTIRHHLPVEPVVPVEEQRVVPIDPEEAQRVTNGTTPPSRFAGVGKVVFGVTAALISVGVMVVSWLFI